MTAQRRRLLQLLPAAAGAALAAAATAARAQAEPGPVLTGPRPAQRTPGKPGDFDFLDGRWSIVNHRFRDGRWDRFDGEARCFGILGGVCSVEELRIPSRNFSGMGLRLLDLKTRVWMDHWVNAEAGVIGSGGLPGSFEQGAGIFESEEDDAGTRVLYRSVWDRITVRSCRWQQGVSRDGGRSWRLDWSMDWTRV